MEDSIRSGRPTMRPLAYVANTLAILVLCGMTALAAVVLATRLVAERTEPGAQAMFALAGLSLLVFGGSLLVIVRWLDPAGWRRGAGLAGGARGPVLQLTVGTTLVLLAINALAYRLIPGADALVQVPEEGILAMIVATVVIAPLVEEFVFRGFLQGRLATVLPGWAAIVLPAALFSLVHFDGGWLYPALVLPSGLALGWLRRRTGSIGPGIAVHAAFNAAAVAALLS